MEHFFLLNGLKEKFPTPFESNNSDISDSEIASIQEYLINISTEDNLSLILQPKERKQFEDLLCSFLKVKTSIFFKKWIKISEMESVPLEFLYLLHTNGVLQVTTVLYFHPTFGNKLCSDLISIVFCDNYTSNDLEVCTKIVTTILSALINVGTHSLRQLFSLSASVLESFSAQLLLHLSIETILKEITIIIRDEKVNLKYLLFIIALLCEITDNIDIIKGYADEWFKEGINTKNENNTLVALLVIRQYSALAKKYFVSYSTWFGSLQIKSASVFSFLFKFLSKIVPHEPPVFLKIQVTKVPSAPTNGQQVLTDYISLAKTRLADLKEPSEYMGLFNDFHETLQEQQESDVGRVIAQYSESKEISKAVMEASVFRKHYYEKFFLRSLLSVAESSDRVRGELIKKLHTAGKIPSSLYDLWAKL